MTLAPLFFAPFAVQLHVVAAICALLIGPVALFRRSRDRWHRRAGYVWIVAMGLTALSSFWVSGFRLIGPFSPIHALSIYVLWGLARGVIHARNGQVRQHRETMRGMYVWAMGVAGLFTFLPGRRMNHVVAPDQPWLGFAGACIVIGGVLFWVWLRDRPGNVTA